MKPNKKVPYGTVNKNNIRVNKYNNQFVQLITIGDNSCGMGREVGIVFDTIFNLNEVKYLIKELQRVQRQLVKQNNL